MPGLVITAAFDHDINEVEESLAAVERDVGKLIREVAKRELAPVVASIKALLPYDPAHRGWKGHDSTWHAKKDPGHIRDSVVAAVAGNSLVVRSTHPGGPVHWWGGTIRPRSSVIEIHPRPGGGAEFVTAEAERAGDRFDSALGELLHSHNL